MLYELEASSRIPYAQVQSPPNLDVEEIIQENKPYGVYLLKEQADLVGFQPDSNWSEKTIVFGKGDKKETQTGFLTTTPRFVVLSQSGTEVEKGEWQDNGKTIAGNWRYEGLLKQFGEYTRSGFEG